MAILGIVVERLFNLLLFTCVAVPGAAMLFLVSERRLKPWQVTRLVSVMSPTERAMFAGVSMVATCFATAWATFDLVAFKSDAFVWQYASLFASAACVAVGARVWTRVLVAVGLISAGDAKEWPRRLLRGEWQFPDGR